MHYLPALVFFAIISFLTSATILDTNRNCSCGFYDVQTGHTFTESIIVYFNETSSIPHGFVIEDYENKYEKDWNAIYRQGASPVNVVLNGSGSLDLLVTPPIKPHLVEGGGIRTRRRDIQHGTFRAWLRAPMSTSRTSAHGSAISMMWQYNETEVAEVSVMNTNVPSDAWIGTFINNEFTTRELGVNFSTIIETPSTDKSYTTLDGGLANQTADPWDYTEYRLDWSRDVVDFFVAGNLTRSVPSVDNRGIPSVPSPFYFKHWSTGNRFTMQGPPEEQAVASIGWIRMFFNSSSTQDARSDLAARCWNIDPCMVDDISLRGATPFEDHSVLQWKQADNKSIKRTPALWISVICISISSCLLLHAFIRRAPWRKHAKGNSQGQANAAPVQQLESGLIETPTPVFEPPSTQRTSSEYENGSKDGLTISISDPSPSTSVWGDSTHCEPSRQSSMRYENLMLPRINNQHTSFGELCKSQLHPHNEANSWSRHVSERTLVVPQVPGPADKIPMETVTESALPAPRMRPQPPPPRDRVDYLAGLVAICALLVTVMHFGLTFVPAMVVPGAPRHYESEYWAQQIIAPFVLNQMWLGVFFTTSVRFLVAGYLRRGNMLDVAKAAVRRTPRLMIPVASIALLEYFVIDCGATSYLRYIPSLTWSTWPYVTRFPTVGHYISGVLELIYLVPNAVPQITFNYCTGVLWTIAVQLQGTWIVLCGAVVVYEIKTPWKRMCYYLICITSHWYAQSWGSYLWLGLLLTDLDVTYKYKQWLNARPAAYYPLLTFCWICVAAGFSANIIANWLPFNFPAYEHNIHPDADTGEPLWNTANAGYPAYHIPRLNGLLFAGGMQAIVELSPTVQYVLSLPFLMVLFPHIFTIYLMHGLVFWSWGSWLMVFLANRSISYGINVTVVGVTSYLVLFAILPIVTPIIEALGKDITSMVWMTAIEKSPPKHRTLFPFPKDLLHRPEQENNAEITTESVGNGSVMSSEKVVARGKTTGGSEV